MSNVELVEGREYRVIDNLSLHDFSIGDIVRLKVLWGEGGGIFEYLDGSDLWAMNNFEVEEVE